MTEKRMLLSFAHPDDESFGMAGTIARYAAEGTEVYLICSTNGDVGSAEPQFMEGFDTPGQMRLAELDCAAKTLGIKQVFAWGYRDSGMVGMPENEHPDCLVQANGDEVVAKIVEAIRRVRPQVVVTFDPYGGYGHPDHLVMHHATTQAFHAASDSSQYPDQLANGLEPYKPEKLYYRTNRRGVLKARIAMMRLQGQEPERVGRNKEIDLTEIAAHAYPIHAVVKTQQYREVAEQARQCHASQIYNFGRPGIWDRVARFLYGNTDTFMRVEPPVNGNSIHESDLFSGLSI